MTKEAMGLELAGYRTNTREHDVAPVATPSLTLSS